MNRKSIPEPTVPGRKTLAVKSLNLRRLARQLGFRAAGAKMSNFAGSRFVRASGAVLVFFVVLMLGSVAIYFAGWALFGAADQIFPAVVGSGHNTNSTNGPQSTFWWTSLLAIFSTALVCSLAVWDRSFGRRTEMIGVGLALLVIGSASAVNFAAHDQLMDVRAQAVIDFIQAAIALSLAIFIYRWNVLKPIAIALKFMLLVMVVIFFFTVPILFGVTFTLSYFGFGSPGLDLVFKLLGGLSAVLTVVVGIHNFARPVAVGSPEKPLRFAERRASAQSRKL